MFTLPLRHAPINPGEILRAEVLLRQHPLHKAVVPMLPDLLLAGSAAAAAFLFLIAVLWRPELF
jgi:hypothetical protein